ncbi:MAG TPA: ABC-F family ATP-binding cassette domain-containing protein, partial [Kofleriaceae bacterium]|nr:ABC-F family ATP-binding cassette domain-containing protein [Kofleriaceae bacterium]
MTAILTAQGLEKRFGTRLVLRGASFAVHERDRIGMIGANGAGKSTLLEMVVHRAMGGDDPALEPDAGVVTWKRDLALEYVAQEPVLDPAATVAATLARDGVADHEIATIAMALELPPGPQAIGTLSLGERRRVALGRALLGKADVLALDEPTNHLDATTVEWLENRLAVWPGALIVVTHDRYFLDRVATRILEVDRGKAYAYDGDYAEFVLIQAERLSTEAEAEYQRSSFIRREIDWIRRGPPARTVKAKARIDRFDAAVAAAPTVDDKRGDTMALRLPSGPRLGSTIVELAKASKSLGGKQLFKDLTLVMKPGDRIGIVGPNGAGKSTLIKTILGQLAPDTGRVVIGANTRPAYLEQGRTELRDELTVIEEVGDGYDYVDLPDGKIHVRSFLRMLAFPDSVLDTKVGQLSGGERNRVQLARLLRRGGNLLVLDEPTNDLDLPTLGALEDGLIHFAGCALIVSHDRWFLDRVATGILAFEGDGVVTFYEGSYTFYAERRPRPAGKPAERDKRESRDTRTPTKPVGPRKLTFKEARELEAIEATIAAAEDRVTTLEATLSNPGVFKDRPTEVQALIGELDAARAEVERLFARWQELDALK